MLQALGYPARGFSGLTDFSAAYDPDRPGCLVLEIAPAGEGDSAETVDWLRGASCPLPVIVVASSKCRCVCECRDDTPPAERQRRGLEYLDAPIDSQRLIHRIDSAFQRDAERRRHVAAAS